MGLIASLSRRDQLPAEQRSAQSNFFEKLDELDFFGITSKSGKKVTTGTSLQVSAVFACVNVLSNGCAQPPLHVWRSLAGGRRQRANNLRIYRILNRRPNAWMTSFELRRTLTAHAALAGDAFAFKNRINGEIRELIPVAPGNVTIENLPDREIRYHVSDDNGDVIGRFGRRDIFHLRGLSWDSLQGMDVIRLARDAIGLSIASEESQSKLHANGGKPGGILTTEQALQPEQVNRIREAWQKRFGGSKNAFGTAVLDKGMDFKPLAMTGVDAQHLETRKHQIEEVCRFFNVYPQMVMQSDKTSTFASAEAFFAAHVRNTLAPWHELWLQTLDEFLLDGQGPLYAEFDTREMTKASIADREAFYRTVTEMGIYTRNEIREMEGLEPLAGLDEPLTPRNMGTGQEAGDA